MLSFLPLKGQSGRGGGVRGLEVIFSPWWPTNPYHKLLSEHLGKLGVRVRGVRDIFFLPVGSGRRRPDVLHLHAPYRAALASNAPKAVLKLTAFLLELLVLRLAGIRIVWTVHELKNHENRYPNLDRICTVLVAGLAHAIVVHCKTAGREVAGALSARSREKVAVVPHGNYLGYYENKVGRAEAREILGIRESDLVFLFLGLIRAYKGVPELIDVFDGLGPEGARLMVVGRMANEEIAGLLERKAAGRDDVEVVPGFVPDDRIQEYMNACDVVVLPYRDIMTSGSVLLAMSFGKACVAPRMGCIGDVLDDSGALLYDPDGEEGLSDAINRAVRRRHDLPRMGEYNRRLVERWGWDQTARMTLDVYRNLLGPPKMADG